MKGGGKMKFKAGLAMFVACALVAGGAFAGEVSLQGLFDREVISEDASLVRLSYQDQEPEQKKDKGPGDWGGFGGPMLTYFTMDLSALDPMTDDRGVDEFNDQFILIGGLGGVIYKDFRFGGFGFGNEQDTSGRVLGERRSAEMSFGGGGLFFELNHAFNPNFGLLAGAMVGAGTIDLEASGDDLGLDEKWDADGNFFMWYPYAGFWVAPTSWMWVQIDGGALLFDMDTGGSEFENDLNVDMVDDNLAGGMQVCLKLNFGYNPAVK